MRVALSNGSGHEDVGNAHLKDRDKGEVLERTKKVCAKTSRENGRENGGLFVQTLAQLLLQWLNYELYLTLNANLPRP